MLPVPKGESINLKKFGEKLASNPTQPADASDSDNSENSSDKIGKSNDEEASFPSSVDGEIAREIMIQQVAVELELNESEYQFTKKLVNTANIASAVKFSAQAIVPIYLAGLTTKLLSEIMGEFSQENYDYLSQYGFHVINLVSSLLANVAFVGGEVLLVKIKNAWLNYKQQQVVNNSDIDWNKIQAELEKQGIQKTDLQDSAVRTQLIKFFFFGTFFFAVFGYVEQLMPDVNNSIIQRLGKAAQDYSKATLVGLQALGSAGLGWFFSLARCKPLNLEFPKEFPYQVAALLFGLQVASTLSGAVTPSLESSTAKIAVKFSIRTLLGAISTAVVGTAASVLRGARLNNESNTITNYPGSLVNTSKKDSEEASEHESEKHPDLKRDDADFESPKRHRFSPL